MIAIVTSALLVVLAAAPSVVSLPLGPLDLLGPSDPQSPLVLNSPLRSQYHAQDELGQYSYGYSGGPSAKHEERSADGVVRGSFAYVDPNGKVQTRSYVADDLNGFRVVASDIPQQPQPMPFSGPGYASAPAPAPYPAGWLAPQVPQPQRDPHWISRWSLEQSPSYVQGPQLAVGSTLGDGFIVPSSAKQLLYSPLGAMGLGAEAIRSQFHAQDEAGQYTYGYSNENSSKSETKTADGVTRGSYSYVDPRGLLQTRSYVADADGFRVAASDLP